MGFRLAAYAAFVLSGVAGLVYEVLWARYLGLLVGHTAYAQVIVLAVFLGGMGAGALLVGARSTRLADPLRWYARIEILIGLFGFAFDPVFRGLMGTVFERLLPAAGTGPAGLVATWTVACLAILPQSLLLGATFPLMTAGILRRQSAQPGRMLAMLYGANSGGAALGALVAGFLLIPALGLPGAVLSAGVLNVMAGAIAFVLSGTTQASVSAPSGGSRPVTESYDPSATIGPLLLVVAAGTAIASFLYEVAWIRMLALLLSSATHAFEVMLSAFILGLALGAFWVRRGADGWKHPVRALGIIQFVMGCAALATLPLYHEAFEWMVWLMRTFARTDPGYLGFSIGRYTISLAIMLPATFCAGATLPLITRVLLTRGVGEAAIGRVYGVNTLGSIAGVVLAGLILLPMIGLKAMLITGAALDIALGVMVLAATTQVSRRLALAAAVAGIVLVGTTALGPSLDRQLLASGVFRTGTLLPAASIEPLYQEDGRTATVTVYHALWANSVVIATNGKPDGSLPDAWLQPCGPGQVPRPMTGDVSTQALAPLITLAHRPDADRAAIIGFGSGMSTQLLLSAAPALGSLVTIEIEPAILRAARMFLPANRRAYDDPRSRLVIEDARAYFARTGERFDYIFSEPSNPWVAGVSGLFTTEFYARVRRALTDDGVFGQWLHLYELNDELVQSVLAAIHENFGAYAVYQSDNTNILIVASPASTLLSPQWPTVFEQPTLRQDLCHSVPVSSDMMDATWVADRVSLAPLLDGGTGANSDLYPVLDVGADHARYLRQRAGGLMDLAAARFDFLAALRGARLGRTTETTAVVPSLSRQLAQATAAALRVPRSAAPADQSNTHSRARYLLARWNRELDAGIVPNDWATWLADFDATERLVHGATRGLLDEPYYRRVEQFIDATAAPDPVRQMVLFRRGLTAWDFRLAREAGLALAREHQLDLPITPRDLMEGLITAHLMLGDPQTADSLFQSLATQVRPAEVDLRLLLLGAHVRHAQEARAERRPTPS